MKAKGLKEKAEAEAVNAAPLGLNVTMLFKNDKELTVHKNGELFDVAKDGKKVTPDPLTRELTVMYIGNYA